jgi:dynamin 1-like protein
MNNSQPDNYGNSRGKGEIKLDSVPVTLKQTHMPSDKENFEAELISNVFLLPKIDFFVEFLLVSYFDIVRKNVKDSVPKTIMHFLVNRSKEMIQNELVAALYREELFDDLLEESTLIAQRREETKKMMDYLKKAHEILNEVRDFQVNL